MALNRKAFFFTVTALFVVAILLLVLTAQRSVSGIDRLPGQEVQIEQGRNLVVLVEEGYLPRVIQTIGFVELNELIREEILPTSANSMQGSFLTRQDIRTNLTAAFEADEVGVVSYLERLATKVEETQQFTLNFEEIGSNSVTVFQDETTGPWNVGISIVISYSLSGSEATWNREDVVVTGLVPIEGLPEPFYAKQGVVLPLKRTTTTAWNVTALETFIENRESRYRAAAPSFLSRLTGDIDASDCCGYESFVHPNEVGLAPMVGSSLDWCMFSPTSNNNCGSPLVFVTEQMKCSDMSSALHNVRASSETFTRFYNVDEVAATCV